MIRMLEPIRRAGVSAGILRPTIGDVEREAGLVLRARAKGDREAAAKARERHARLLQRLVRRPA